MAAGLFWDFAKDDRGATAIEYGLIAGLIAVGIIAALTAFGGSMTGMFNNIQNRAGGAMDSAGN
jgi:pilus assembly protein Flp/PilA